MGPREGLGLVGLSQLFVILTEFVIATCKYLINGGSLMLTQIINPNISAVTK